MTYRAIGLMSGSSLDGLDIAFVEFNETGGKWSYEIKAADCFEYSREWIERLKNAVTLSAYEYQLLHASYGKYIGEQVNKFIDVQRLHHQVQLIASHGHTTFHNPHVGMTGQLGDGAAIAATTEINVVSDLRALDVAFGGQGAPIVPIGEKLLFDGFSYFLNVGGIANISFNHEDGYIAYDVCAANRVLNMLSQLQGKEYDSGGEMSASGEVNVALLNHLNSLDYYKKTFPKSLANSFGIEEVFPLVHSYNLSVTDTLRTYVEHMVIQISSSLQQLKRPPTTPKESFRTDHRPQEISWQESGAMRQEAGGANQEPKDEIQKLGNGVTELPTTNSKLLVTGGGAFNTFLIKRLKENLHHLNIEVIVPDPLLVNYKEALIMALIGVLRWREEYNVLSTVTGARRSSIGGAVWIGQEA